MMPRVTICTVVILSCVLATPLLRAATCYWDPGHLGAQSGDSVIYPVWSCRQSSIDAFWSRYSMARDDWDDGFGFEAPCDQNRPLARTFNAIAALAYS